MIEEGKTEFGYDPETNQPIITYTNRIGKVYTMSACAFDQMIKQCASKVDRTFGFIHDREVVERSCNIAPEHATELTELLYAHDIKIEDFLLFAQGEYFTTVSGRLIICPYCFRIDRIKPEQDIEKHRCLTCKHDVATSGVIHK